MDNLPDFYKFIPDICGQNKNRQFSPEDLEWIVGLFYKALAPESLCFVQFA